MDQDSVLKELKPNPGKGTVRQYRPGPENSHVRIMCSNTEVFWTLGLSHDERRAKGKFSVYRRTGLNKFEHVSGEKHPKDPN